MNRLVVIALAFVLLVSVLGMQSPRPAEARTGINLEFIMSEGCSSGWYVIVRVYENDKVVHRDEGCYVR
jgi:hypothetical protein